MRCSQGEIDFIEQPPHDLLPLAARTTERQARRLEPARQPVRLPPQHLHKPFDNPKIRQALWYAFNQEDFLKAVVGDAKYYKVCKALFLCGTPLASTRAWTGC